MTSISRRQLAKYAVDSLQAGKSAGEISKHLAASLLISRRQTEVDLLLSDIDQQLEERRELAKARVTTAYPLSSVLKRQLTARLKELTGAKGVVLQEQVDNKLIGGLKIETATRSWDKSIARVLSVLKRSSLNG